MRLAWVLVVMSLLTGGAAAADTKVLQFARSTPLPASARQLPDHLAKAIAAALGATVSEESLLTLRCGDESETCLAGIARDLDASEIVYGTIRPGVRSDNKLVTITRYAPGAGRAQETFLIELGEDAPKKLVREAKPFLESPLRKQRDDGEPSEERAPPREPPPREVLREVESVRDEEPRRAETEDLVIADAPRRRKISTGTYLLLGGGGVTLAGGLYLTLSAWALRDDVARAPVDDVQDFNRLEMLEQRGKTYTTAGAVMTVGGSALVIWGAVRAWRERRSSGTSSALTFVPTRDGGAVAFTRSW